MIRTIAGRHNHSLKLARKLQQKKHRRERGLLVCEGLDLVLAAWEAGATLQEILIRSDLVARLPSSLIERAERDSLDIGVCEPELLASASSLGGSADVIVIAAQPSHGLGQISFADHVVVYLENVGDPGNVGTIIRSTAALGASGVICGPASADPYGPKALRAGMGAHFSVPVVTEVSTHDLAAKLGAMQTDGVHVEVLVADPRGETAIAEIGRVPAALLVLGDERLGPSRPGLGGRRVRIPQRREDSLNVAMAATILLYELCRP